ncbi:MAG: hypothetical protein K9J13_07505 [Saprospiraceae bacterium]|nr:hypothetical protein [Saprospiraceae bacterium]
MKTSKITLLIIMIISGFTVLAQDNKEMEYLFQKGKVSISGFGGFTTEFSAIQNEFAVLTGGGGAAIFNQKFFIGGYGMGLSTKHIYNNVDTIVKLDADRISFGHGGFWIGYLHNSHKIVHLCGSAKIGWGQIAVYDEYYDYKEAYEYQAKDNVFVATPQLEVELNLTKWFKVNFAGGYRFVAGIDKSYSINGVTKNYYDSSDFSGPVANISFLFGGFGVK